MQNLCQLFPQNIRNIELMLCKPSELNYGLPYLHFHLQRDVSLQSYRQVEILCQTTKKQKTEYCLNLLPN